jgi:hypothetical protein
MHKASPLFCREVVQRHSVKAINLTPPIDRTRRKQAKLHISEVPA